MRGGTESGVHSFSETDKLFVINQVSEGSSWGESGGAARTENVQNKRLMPGAILEAKNHERSTSRELSITMFLCVLVTFQLRTLPQTLKFESVPNADASVCDIQHGACFGCEVSYINVTSFKHPKTTTAQRGARTSCRLKKCNGFVGCSVADIPCTCKYAYRTRLGNFLGHRLSPFPSSHTKIRNPFRHGTSAYAGRLEQPQ